MSDKERVNEGTVRLSSYERQVPISKALFCWRAFIMRLFFFIFIERAIGKVETGKEILIFRTILIFFVFNAVIDDMSIHLYLFIYVISIFKT